MGAVDIDDLQVGFGDSIMFGHTSIEIDDVVFLLY